MAQEIVRFTPNVPVEASLRFPTGKLVPGNFGQQVMFSIEGGKVMYLDLGVAQKINDLALKPGETFFICQRWTGKKGEPRTWDAWLSPATEKCRAAREMAQAQPEDTAEDLRLRQQLAESIALQNMRKGNASSASPISAAPRSTGTHGPVPQPQPAPQLVPKAAPAPGRQQYSAAFQEFLIAAGRATKAAENVLGVEGASIRFDSRDIAAIATSMFIEAARHGGGA